MTDKLKDALNSVRADDRLKSETVSFLNDEIRKRSGRKKAAIKGFATVGAIAAMFVAGLFSYNLYFTAWAYVDMDINPSIELAVNRFDRVVYAGAYNEKGAEVLAGLSLMHKGYREALAILLETVYSQGYLEDDSLLSITVQADGGEGELLTVIQNDVAIFVDSHLRPAQTDIFTVSHETRGDAHAHGMTPAKYLAIQELIAVDATVSVSGCANHTISEIRDMTQARMGNRHGADDDHAPESGVPADDGHGGDDDDRGDGDDRGDDVEHSGADAGLDADEHGAASEGHHGNKRNGNGHN